MMIVSSIVGYVFYEYYVLHVSGFQDPCDIEDTCGVG